MPMPFTPKANTMMFWRMMRTVSLERRTSNGNSSPVAGQEREVLDSGLVQLGNHACRFRADSVAGTDRPEHDAVAGYQQGGLAGHVQLTQDLSHFSREDNPFFFQEPWRADNQHAAAGPSRDARAGLSQEFFDRPRR